MTSWTKTSLTLRYHWKAILVGVVAFSVGLFLTFLAWAKPEGVVCAHWNEDWFHHLTTSQHVRYCIAQKRVDINQRDEEGRTLLIRVAEDLRSEADDHFYIDVTHNVPEPFWLTYPGNTREVRTAIAKELLRWPDQIDLDIADDSGKTAWQYAVRRKESRPLAVLLLDAGATISLAPSSKEKIEQDWLPVIRMLGRHVKNPFEGEVDFDDLFNCQTADCLLGETVKED